MDWAASDSIREKIEARGWSVQDTPEGQKVVRQL
jgi:cysteinyl-tRNA synthetase